MNRIYLLLLLLIANCGFSQITGTVTDSVSGKPVPYANIWIDAKAIGSTSEADGTFQIGRPGANTILVFSAIGFETKKAAVSDKMDIRLKPEIYQLDEVSVSTPKGTSSIEIGESEKNGLHQISIGKTPWTFAKYFPYEKSYGANRFIKNAMIATRSEIDGALFRLRILKVGPDGAPGEDLVTENIIIAVKKGNRKNIIDLTAYHLEIPAEGIFIGFEHMFIEQNRYSYKKNGKKLPSETFGPEILTYSTERPYTYIGWTGDWAKQTKGKSPTQVLWEPAINLTLTN